MAFAKRSARVELPRMAGESPALGRSGSVASIASRKRLPSSVPKVFVITGNPESANLDVVREELINRGFTEGEGEEFLLKWGPRSKVDWRALAPPQLVNHYEHDFALTTKSGLAEALQASSSPVDSRDFYPTSFHLDRASAIFEFAQEFKFSKAWCLPKEWLAHQEGGIVPETFSDAVIRTALQVVKRRMEDIDSQLMADTNEAKQVDFAVKRREWDVLSAADFDHPGVNGPCEDWLHDSLRRQQAKQDKKQLLEKYDRKLQQIAEHSKVEFSIRQIDNKTEAIDVHVLGHGGHGPVIPAHRPGSSDGANAAEKGAQVRHLVGQRLEGSVRSFRDSWGFVVSEAFQGDLDLHRRNNSELGPVQAGDPVSFQVLEDPPGHFQAVGCQVLPVPLAQLMGQRLFGWVKAFYPEDWGFLASLRFEGELFVSLDNNPRLKTPLKSGESVVFNIQQETGELHAVDVARSNSTVQKDTKEGQTCIGKVKSFRGEWGFITSDSLEGDVFLHLRDNPGLPPLSPGETVEFTVGGSERLHAENVRLLRRTSPLSELLGQICSGTVRKFSGEWGFITSPHFDGDIFVGLRSNRHLGGPLVTGDIVEFRITRDVSKEKDTFEASNVRILSPATHATTSPVLPVPVPSARSRSPRKALEMATLVGKKLTGTVRSFRGDWGFVISESFAGDLFVGTRSNGHLSTSLKEGDMISFRVEIGSGKAEAVNVELI